jgi:nucleoid-associated protein YgaU
MFEAIAVSVSNCPAGAVHIPRASASNARSKEGREMGVAVSGTSVGHQGVRVTGGGSRAVVGDGLRPAGPPARPRGAADRAVRRAAREAALERAVRAHPAGRALGPRPGTAGGTAGAGRLRLTTRGRLVLAVLLLALAVASAALVGGVFRSGSAQGLHLAGESRVVVHPGDTLWSIARSVAGDADVRVVVDRIQQVNDLPGTVLVPGQVLRLP